MVKQRQYESAVENTHKNVNVHPNHPRQAGKRPSSAMGSIERGGVERPQKQPTFDMQSMRELMTTIEESMASNLKEKMR
jgi:hypothetical protein